MSETVSCCPDPGIEAIVDFQTYGSAKNFLERIGVLTALRNPEPRIQPAKIRPHDIPLQPPLPTSELQEPLLGETPPDRGKSLHWPHPDLEAEEKTYE
jgi:hypothetical protein